MVRHTKKLFTLDFLEMVSSCESPTVFSVAGAGFARRYRLYEENKFVLSINEK